jgi:PAS domain-containing protein
MSDKSSRRRRSRSGSTSARYKASQLVPFEQVSSHRIGKAELAACCAVAIVALALVALIWIVAVRAVQGEYADVRERAEQSLAGEAATMSETIAHELLLVDQSLMVLQSAWQADSQSFDLVKWKAKMPALLAIADDIFICDDKHVIRQDILPQAVGQGVGTAYLTFPHGSLETFDSDGTQGSTASVLLQGDTGAAIDARQYLMYLVRPLGHPTGWLIGASFRSAEITKLFADASLGFNPVVALVDTRRGVLQAVVGPAARQPNTNLSKSGLYTAIKRVPVGTWLGDTGIDGVERLHAYHVVPNRDMAVVVAANWAEVERPAMVLAATTRGLAGVATIIVFVIGGLVLWGLATLRANRRQTRIFARNRSELERLRSEDASLSARASLNASRLQVVLDNASDGIALLNANLRLVQWNQPFARGIGIALAADMPLDGLLRVQAEAGLFSAEDAEVEIARRVAILRTGEPEGLPQPGPSGETLVLRGMVIAEGGFMLLLNGLLTWTPQVPVRQPSMEEDAPGPEPMVQAPAAIEW